MSVLQALVDIGAEIIAVDQERQRIEEVQDMVSLAIQMDSTDESTLVSQGVHEVDVAVVCIGEDFLSNLLTAVTLKNLGVPKVVARATREIEEKILKTVGIDMVVIPEIEVGEKLAYSLIHQNLRDIVHLAGSTAMAEIDTPEDFIGKSLLELNLRAKHKVNLIMIKKPKKIGTIQTFEINSSPGAETIIEPGDILVLVGDRKDITKIAKMVKKNEE
ncbi:MAG: TrkA family potassium uptake protein [Methanobacteriota archaeon]|nr:MAG: TrkA family potassium uptake protein [Euryarchaeota archaeon]